MRGEIQKNKGNQRKLKGESNLVGPLLSKKIKENQRQFKNFKEHQGKSRNIKENQKQLNKMKESGSKFFLRMVFDFLGFLRCSQMFRYFL